MSQEKDKDSEMLLEVLKFQCDQIKMLADTFGEMTNILQGKDKKFMTPTNQQDEQEKYDVIYADPPWSYGVTKQTIPSRADDVPYVPMRLVDILSLPVNRITKENSVLFLWTTMPLIPEALYTIRSWGFEYKTVAFTWVKKAKTKEGWFWGMGSWTRSNPELCLLATRGSPKRISASVHSIIDSPVREHSRKPDETRERIEILCGSEKKKIELFARDKKSGWDVWGNEVSNDINL